MPAHRCDKKTLLRTLLSTLLVCVPAIAHPLGAASFSSERPGFSVKFRNMTSPHRVFGIYALPEERIPIQVMDPDPKSTYALTCTEGDLRKVDAAKWVWRAPSRRGLFTLVLRDRKNRDAMSLNVFVMVPYANLREGCLNGYRIGKYPQGSVGLPAGFVEVTKENGETFVSPHFQLKQFLCKQEGGYPKYVVLKEKLLLKLELVLQRVNETGLRCDSFTVMSGYRTPHYNQSLGNSAYSRHLWGEAADIFIDQRPRDDMMDDLNGDGKVDWRDAKVICRIIEEMADSRAYQPFAGGLAAYKRNQCHGPFVHVDVRGSQARWGR